MILVIPNKHHTINDFIHRTVCREDSFIIRFALNVVPHEDHGGCIIDGVYINFKFQTKNVVIRNTSLSFALQKSYEFGLLKISRF